MTTLSITVNGKHQRVDIGATIADVVAEVTGQDPDSDELGVAAALNAEVVPRSSWSSTILSENADIEIITAMQGG